MAVIYGEKKKLVPQSVGPYSKMGLASCQKLHR